MEEPLEYLPEVYLRFCQRYPQVAAALDGLGAATEAAGPLDETHPASCEARYRGGSNG